ELRYPSFLPDGKHYLAMAAVSASGGGLDRVKSAVVVGSLDRSQDLTVVVHEASEAHYAAGHLIYVHDGNLVGQPFDVGRLATTGEPVTLAEGVSFTPGSGIAAFSVAGSTLVHAPDLASFANQLSWFDRQGHMLGTVGPAGDLRAVDVSPEGALTHMHDE